VNISCKELPIQQLATDVVLNIYQNKTVLVKKPTIKINVPEFQQHDGMSLWE
jgi:predicted metallo-beta-lactamase superfamily hydrolase